MNILIVEDSRLELQRIKRMVEEAAPDSRVSSYYDSQEAAAAIEQGILDPDIAFLDIEMPSPNGLALAKILFRKNSEINIIFTTAYSAYMKDAFDMFASGYLLKPFSSDAIRQQLSNLRHPPRPSLPRYFAQTRGEFDFFHYGVPVPFSSARAKEVLAYLIDRRGASVTKKELFSILFEDTEYTAGKQDYMKKIVRSLKSTLDQIDGQDLLIHNRNCYSINIDLLESDIDDIIDNNTSDTSKGYMEQYSWAEYHR